MKILIINFEMNPNSKVLAWQLKVALEIAKKNDKVVVITESLALFSKPENMEVFRVPRLMQSPLRILGAKWLLNVFVYRLCQKYRFDACFIHMNMEWAYQLYPCFWQFKLPVLMWYAHGTVTSRLKMAHHCATRIITSTPEGFRIPSHKVKVIGQGIDTSVFNLQQIVEPQTDIVTVGRISRRKRVHLLIEVMHCLLQRQKEVNFRLLLIGATLNRADLAYQQELQTMIVEKRLQERVKFLGHVNMEKILPFYQSAFLHLNVSQTGSMDKTVLEALACGCPVLTSNEAFFELLENSPKFIINEDTPEAIANQVLHIYQNRKQIDSVALRNLVVGKHDINSYIAKVMDNLQEISGNKLVHI